MKLNENRLFAQLAKTDQASIQRLAEREELSARQVLATPSSKERCVYFPTGASVALLVRDGNRPGLALGLVGQEGAVGLHFALGPDPGIFTLLVQSPGTAWRVDGLELNKLARQRPALLLAVSRYMWTMAQEVAVHAAFAQIGDVKARLARWLISSSARSPSGDLLLTQLHLADMLGVRRATITLAAIELKALGVVEYRRGRLRILNARGLEAIANAVASDR